MLRGVATGSNLSSDFWESLKGAECGKMTSNGVIHSKKIPPGALAGGPLAATAAPTEKPQLNPTPDVQRGDLLCVK